MLILNYSTYILRSARQTSAMVLKRSLLKNSAGFNQITRYKHVALKKEKEKLRTYVIQKYLDYLNSYTKILEKKFPNVMNMYRVFSIGIKDFLTDLKNYISLRIKVYRDLKFSQLSLKDIELFQKMPSDMLRITPVLILSAIPFGNYLVFPLAFWKPKQLLCSHFWSIQQRAEFATQDLRERLKYNKPVFRALQAKLDYIPDEQLKQNFSRVVGLLGSGVHPSPQEVLSCKNLFSQGTYQLDALTYNHLGYLLKMHGLRKSIFRKNKLKYRAFLIMEMDKAIEREGGVEEMNTDALRNACRLRGLHDTYLTNKDMKIWLEKWLTVSRDCDKKYYSLILHSPIFFAYNNPQNWALIY